MNEFKKAFDFHGQQMDVIMNGIRNRCKTCKGTRRISVANGPDDFDVVLCPDCSLDLEENDTSGATTDDR